MERLRQTPIKKRVAIGFIAVCALLLQGFLAASAPAIAFAPSDGIICAQNESGAPLPASEHHPHKFCCILACVAWASAYLTATPVPFAFPARKTSDVVFASASEHGARAARTFQFSARGPPQGL
ncbi:MAG TPA: hypothetical protein VIE66_12790 [Methylocella sp.]|jgi:hypothetical protein